VVAGSSSSLAVGATLRLLRTGASGSNLDLTSPLVWVLIAISAAGAVVTFAFLVYAVVKFRDPATRGRRYG
jgi:hypothetical protein